MKLTSSNYHLISAFQMAMQRCPVEIWEQILSNACTDGGYTGCSLSVVSRTMRDVSRPFRYHSVALLDYTRCVWFANLVERTTSPLLVRHLFVSATSANADMSTTAKPLHTILRATAPTLLSLAVHGVDFFQVLDSSTELYPVLEDLETDWMESSTVRPHQSHSDTPLRRLSALRRLHICCKANLRDLWDALVLYASSITHIRVTNMWASDMDTNISPLLNLLLTTPTPEHAAILGPDACYRHGAPWEGRTREIVVALPRLKQVYLQPYAETLPGRDGPLLMPAWIMEDRLYGVLCPCCERGQQELCMLPGASDYDIEEARARWLDIVEGGEGPWTENAFVPASRVSDGLNSRPPQDLAENTSNNAQTGGRGRSWRNSWKISKYVYFSASRH